MSTSVSTASTAASSTSAAATPPRTRRVTDAPTRVFHWLFALCFTGAYLSAESEHWRLVHVTLGYSFAGLGAFRLLLWGLAGPRQARISLMWRKLAGLGNWLNAAKQGKVNTRQAQNLGMAAVVLALLALVLPLTLSGYATYNEWGGEGVTEWLGETHEWFGNLVLALVLGHIGLIALLSVLRKSNVARPMLSGRMPGPGPDLAQRNHGVVAVLLLAAVLGFWYWQWQDSPAQQREPSSVLTSVSNTAQQLVTEVSNLGQGDDGDDDDD